MKKRLLQLVILLLVTGFEIAAQPIDTILNQYAAKFTTEKIHLHLDRSVYTAGETVFFKAYVMTGEELSVLSKNIYIDFYDGDGKLLQQTVAPLLQSSAKGSFSIPQNYKDASFYIKAYTKWMLNFDEAFLYSRQVRVYQKQKAENKKSLRITDTTIVSLFAEGGFAVEGLNNRFAFKAANRNGKPVNIKGILKSSDGQQSDSISSLHDGMGSFRVPLQKGLAYTFEWKDEKGATGISKISAEKKSGAILKVMPQWGSALVSIERSMEMPESFKTMHLLVHKNYNLHYKFDLNMSSKTFVNIPVSTKDFPSGIVQFTLFDDNWLPVGERIIFVNNKNYSFQSGVKLLVKDLSKKGKNEIEIEVGDSLLANMSLAIVDAGSLLEENDPSVYTDFLLSNEIRGDVNNPSYYFSDKDTDSMRSVFLDLVMLTHGHRRYDWDKIARAQMPVTKYPAETDYIGIVGKLTNKKWLRNADKLTMNLMIQGKDSVKTAFLLQGDKEGFFEKKNAFYYDTVKLFYNINDKRSIAGQNMFDFESGLLSSPLRNKFFGSKISLERNTGLKIEEVVDQNNPFLDKQEELRDNSRYKELKEVVLSSRLKTKMKILDEFYTRGVFAGEGNNYKIDVEGDLSARGYTNIFYFLQSKIPGLSVYPAPLGGYVIVTWLKSFSLYGGEKSEPTFFLNEVQVSLDAIQTVPVAEIVYVKAFRPPFVGSFLNGVSGTIAIYTRKGNNPVYEDTTGGSMARSLLVGYTKFVEYTQPDYSDSKSINENDYRATVYWNPFLLTDRFNPRVNVSFYNNDISKRLMLILEGVNLEGKLTRVVKLIE